MTWLWIVLGVVVGVPLLAFVIGSALPRDHVARVSIRVNSTPERVWALVSDLGGTARWRSDVIKVELSPPRFVETTKQGKVTFEIVSQQPPSRQVVRVVDDDQPFGGTWTWELAPEGGGTRVTITEAGFVKNPLFRVMAKLFFPPTRTMEGYLRSLATELGETATPTPL